MHYTKGFVYNVIGGYESRLPSQISSSPGTLVGRRETNTEQSSADIRDPQFRVKRSSQRDQPTQRTASAYKVWGTELTIARNPSLLLASELTDCLATGTTDAHYASLWTSLEIRDPLWNCHGCGAPSLRWFGNRFANYTGRILCNTIQRSIDRTFKYRSSLYLCTLLVF